MLMPEFLKRALDAKLEAAFQKDGQLTAEQRQSVRTVAYRDAQRYIDTHKPGDYPKWGEGHEGILAGNCVAGAIRSLLRDQPTAPTIDCGTF